MYGSGVAAYAAIQARVRAMAATLLTASSWAGLCEAAGFDALIGAINGFRAKLGLAALAVDADLSQRAANAFPDFANAAGVVDVTAIRRDFAATDAAVLRGVVTHRGAKSGAEFPKYWAKDERWNAVMIGDFTHMGAATVKRSDGKLVAFVYLIRR